MICVFGSPMYEGTSWSIVARKNGRYINLRKIGDDNKEFRYDIATGSFDRINHYKKGDKITPVRVKNITGWFTECSIFCDDEKFAKLMIANKYHYNNMAFKSGVRFIEALSSTFARRYEAWLSLGIDIIDIKDKVENCQQRADSYYGYKPRFSVSRFPSPSDIDKQVLKYIQKNYDEISIERIEYFERIRNLDTLMQITELSDDPRYSDVFTIKWSVYRTGRGYEHYTDNIFTTDEELGYSENRIKNNIVEVIDEYNLDIKSFCEFLRRAYYVEGLTLEDLFGARHYPDYLKMERLIKRNKMPKVDKYPRQFLTQFHILKREYNAFKKEYDNIAFRVECDKFRDLEKKYKKYQIIVPEKISDIEDEADGLKHCVRTYIDRVIDGQTLIVFLRDNECPEIPLVTIEVKDGYVTQAYGYQDGKPADEELNTIRKWADEKHLKLSWVWEK